MKLNFKNYQYQTDATQSVVDIFAGQPSGQRQELIGRYERQKFMSNETEIVDELIFSNKKIALTPGEIRHNIQTVQQGNGLPLSQSIDQTKGVYNFTIEMETGTGKTYVYTQTMFELHKQYGRNKFIIMVPSVAIREGVHKSLEITADHFYERYGHKIRFFIYDTKNKSNLVNIKNYGQTDTIDVIVMNYQAFATKSKDARKIYQKLDQTNSRKPIDLIKATRPILIIDEPQRFGKTAEKMLYEFDPLFITRYSATHKESHTKIYRLDAIDAYNHKLVKKINVKGIEVKGSTGTTGYIFCDRIRISTDAYPTAYLEIDIKQKSGISKKIRKVTESDSLFALSGELAQYQGYTVRSIDGRTNTVSFTNGVAISVGQTLGDVSEQHVRRIQIRETIRSHLDKERLMFARGIKVLTLFFIDEVAKYRLYDDNGDWLQGQAEYEKIFAEEYKLAIAEQQLFDADYRRYLEQHDAHDVHAGYFSIDKKGRMTDPKAKGKEQVSNDTSDYDLIMKDKEKLLSLDEPTRFLFSHSALREGRDNPNVFQICTLKRSQSTISKRQEIGRGLRICVNQAGQRMDHQTLEHAFAEYNTLTVIASESYKDFATSLQKEIVESVSDRPTKLGADILTARVFRNEAGETLEMTEMQVAELLVHCKMHGYVDDKQHITDDFILAQEKKTLTLPESLSGFHDEIADFIHDVYLAKNLPLVDDAKADNIELSNIQPNDNFHKKAFQALRDKIKTKTVYEVDFDTKELIEKSITALDAKLRVKKVTVSVSTGHMKDSLDHTALTRGEAMSQDSQATDQTMQMIGTTTYDLVGDIARNAVITRTTASTILRGLQPQVFAQYHHNPEDFIRQASILINEQKATTLINAITYSTTDQTYSDDVFTINQLSGSLQNNILEVKKHIYDFVKTDSKTERLFAQALENDNVMAYAKLPHGFTIPTPIGNYNPDWAIVFDDTTTQMKYVYFIAETKGSMSDLQLKGAERLKIEYARKHFAALGHKDVCYDVVASYEDLMDKVL